MAKLSSFMKKDQKGFTLVEIIVVLAILAILIAVALPSMTGILNDSKGKVIMQDARAALVAYQLKRTDTPFPKPISKATLLKLIDKEGVKTIDVAVTEDATDGVTVLKYSDTSKAPGKMVVIVSEGKSSDVASVYDLTDTPTYPGTAPKPLA